MSSELDKRSDSRSQLKHQRQTMSTSSTSLPQPEIPCPAGEAFQNALSSRDYPMLKGLLVSKAIGFDMVSPSTGETVLHGLCCSSDPSALPLAVQCLSAGADVNAVDFTHWTPLHTACKHGSLELIQLLLDNGALPDSESLSGAIPLHYFCAREFAGAPLTVLRPLLERLAMVNSAASLLRAMTVNMDTVLHYCISGAANAIVLETLCSLGADPNAKNGRGTTPVLLAVARDNLAVITILLKAGGHSDRLAQQFASPSGKTLLSTFSKPEKPFRISANNPRTQSMKRLQLNKIKGLKLEAVVDFEGAKEELTVSTGDALLLEEVDDSGWVKARKGSSSGWLPCENVKIVGATTAVKPKKDHRSSSSSSSSPSTTSPNKLAPKSARRLKNTSARDSTKDSSKDSAKEITPPSSSSSSFRKGHRPSSSGGKRRSRRATSSSHLKDQLAAQSNTSKLSETSPQATQSSPASESSPSNHQKAATSTAKPWSGSTGSRQPSHSSLVAAEAELSNTPPLSAIPPKSGSAIRPTFQLSTPDSPASTNDDDVDVDESEDDDDADTAANKASSKAPPTPASSVSRPVPKSSTKKKPSKDDVDEDEDDDDDGDNDGDDDDDDEEGDISFGADSSEDEIVEVLTPDPNPVQTPIIESDSSDSSFTSSDDDASAFVSEVSGVSRPGNALSLLIKRTDSSRRVRVSKLSPEGSASVVDWSEFALIQQPAAGPTSSVATPTEADRAEDDKKAVKLKLNQLIKPRGKKQRTFIFGGTLDALHERTGNPVPGIVTDCIEFLEAGNFLRTKGLFRISGAQEVVDKIKAAYKTSDHANISLVTTDPHAVTTLLKTFFRSLLEPLLTYELYDRFVDVHRSNVLLIRKLHDYKVLIQSLPPAHLATAQVMFRFIHKVSIFQSDNLMTPTNLGVVFGPNFLRPISPTPDSMLSQIDAGVVCDIITDMESVFTIR
ncbi:MAG: ankyrin repeat domain-containing protein [archaeon]|nr:ankyrin repeat domain-containing protein [archaeon]